MPYVYVLKNTEKEGRWVHGVRYAPASIPASEQKRFVRLPDPPDAPVEPEAVAHKRPAVAEKPKGGE